MLQLVQLPISLYSFKVRLAFAAMAVDVPLVEPGGGSYRSAEYRALVPPASIPALLTPDGVITESDAIIEYVDEVFAGSRLMAGSAWRRARVRMSTRLVDLRLEPAVRTLFAQIARDVRDAGVIADAHQRILGALDVVEWALDPKGRFAIDDAFSMTDCAIAATWAWLDALQGDVLPHVQTGPRFARTIASHLSDPVAGPHVAAYRRSVADWVGARRRSRG